MQSFFCFLWRSFFGIFFGPVWGNLGKTPSNPQKLPDPTNTPIAPAAVQPNTYARLFVFDETLAQLHFAVVNWSDVVMSVSYSPVLTRSLIFLQLWTTVFECMFLQYPNLGCWWFIFSAVTYKVRRVGVEKYLYNVNKLRQNVGLETRIWRQIVTSQTAHRKYKWPQICHWMKPHENFLCTPLLTTFIT